VRTMIVSKHALGFGLVVNAVRPFADIDLLNQRQRGRSRTSETCLASLLVKPCLKGEAIAAPVTPGVSRDRAHELPLSAVQDFDLGRVRNIEARAALSIAT